MTVPVQFPVSTQIATGSSPDFTYDFLVLQKSDMTVTANGVPVQQSDFSITGLGEDNGGIVSILTGNPAAGTVIRLARQVPLSRDIDYQQSGDFRADTVNNDFDRIWMALQDTDRDSVGAIKYPYYENLDGTLPDASARKGMILAFDTVNGRHTMIPLPASVGAGDMVLDTFTAGVDFTGGVTTQLTLSRAPGSPANLAITFDGFNDFDWTVNGTVVTFNTPIPVGVTKVRARIGTTLSMQIPPDDSVGDDQLVWGESMVRVVKSIADLKALDATKYLRAFVIGYYGLGTLGGGWFYFDGTDSSTANDGTIILPNSGSGRWKRPARDSVTLCEFGCIGDGATDDSVRAQTAIDAMKGKTVIRDAGRSFLVAGLTMIGTTYNGTTIRGDGKWKLKPDAGASTYGGGWVGLLIKDCVGVTTYPNWDGNRLAMTDREHIFCEGIAGAHNVTMHDPVFSETRGDCIYIGQSDWQNSSTIPQNVRIGKIRHINSSPDGRNTVSVISVSGLHIESCFARNSGAVVNGFVMPGGIDIEPDVGYQTCRDIYIGPCDISTYGNSGVGVFGKSVSGNDANLDWNCVNITIAPSHISKLGTTGAAITTTPFVRVADLVVQELDTTYDGGVRGRGPLFDFCQRVSARVKTNFCTIGCTFGSLGNVADSDFDIYVNSMDTAGIRSTSISNSTVKLRCGQAIVASTSFGVQLHNESRSVTQTDVTYKVYVPYDGIKARAFRNEPGQLVSVGSGCSVDEGDWTGYPSGLANDAAIPTTNIKGWNDQSTIPTTGTWFFGTFVRNTQPAQGIPAAGKILLGWSRLNTGSNNNLNADWSQVVATIS